MSGKEDRMGRECDWKINSNKLKNLRINIKTIIFFNFQLQYIFNIILFSFQVCSTVVRQSHTLQSAPPDTSSTHLVPCTVTTILLTVFPVLYFTSLQLFCNCQFVLLSPFTLLHKPPCPSHLTTQFVDLLMRAILEGVR